MKIHEYQAKQILKGFGIAVPRGDVAFSPKEAGAVARRLGGRCIVKAQIHAGGRGKGGGVKIAADVTEAEDLARQMIGMTLITHQTGPQGRKVRRVLIEETPSNIRVIFPGDTKEYPAVIGAKDSKLGLGFILIRDLAGKTISPIDLTAKSEPKTGMTLYSVLRLGQGFDHAPMVQRVRISGQVTKPRAMWILQGAGGSAGKPLYDAAGAAAGIVVQQEGVGEGAGSRTFLLPLGVALSTIKNSLKKSKAELERTLEEEEEAAAEAEAEGDDEKKADEPSKDEGEKKDEGKKDDK